MEANMNGRFEGQVAIVTGAGRGIGEATVQRLASEGAAVVVTDIDEATATSTAAAIEAEGGRAIAIVADVTDRASLEQMVAKTATVLGPPDVLVNNAGIAVFADPLELSDEDWKRCFAVDLDGVWFATRAVLPMMLERGSGSVVNVASVHSFQIIAHTFPYPVAKHGVVGMTRALAVEYGPAGLRFNAVCPSYIDTQINIDYYATFPDAAAEKRRVEELHPLRRTGRPDEVAAAIAFFASDECGFATGASLNVDGGRSVVFHDVP
jgi:NAD(P)-dependent dehydrogenase (short-subunit alcohol dehydrogenase family)